MPKAMNKLTRFSIAEIVHELGKNITGVCPLGIKQQSQNLLVASLLSFLIF